MRSFWHKKFKNTYNTERRRKHLYLSFEDKIFTWKTFSFYVAFFIVGIFSAFWEQEPTDIQLYLNQPSKTRIVSPISFEYISEVQTKALKERRRQMILPVYKVDMDGFRNFFKKIGVLKTQLAMLDALQEAEKPDAIKQLIDKFHTKYNLLLETNDLEMLLKINPSLQRDRVLDESLFALQEILQKGISDDGNFEDDQSDAFFLSKTQLSNRFLNLSNALRLLRMNLFAINDVSYECMNACIHVMRHGLVPNLVYDKQRTQNRIEQFVERTPNVTVRILTGTPIVDSGQIVTPEIYERYQAYQQILKQKNVHWYEQTAVFLKNAFIFALLLMSFVLSLKILPTRLNASLQLQVATCCIFILNIILIQLVKYFCRYSSIGQQYNLALLIPYLVPTFFSSLLLTSLTDIFTGFISTFFIIGVKNLMVYGTLETFFLDFFAGILIVFLCRNITFRRDITHATLYGLLLNTCLIFSYNLFDQHVNMVTCLQKILAVFIGGFSTLILTINLISMLEIPFRHTTNITLLNLTDYNHPLLRKLQELAPGTYHHSLMVAALSEKAAVELGANSLLCRCCSLYHDVGKMVKPEYFTENRQGEENPHNTQPPSMSALILKSHIKEGIELAKTYKLPQVIQDVIQQHHGTSVMQYFYQKAILLKEETEMVDIETFRYDGPRPQFKESAIISLADSIEAASRSLPKSTPQALEELIDRIIKWRVADGQLNDCGLTLNHLAILRKSFKMTLSSMGHARISYDKIEEVQKPTSNASPVKTENQKKLA